VITDYGKALGRRLREVRTSQNLTLHGVEALSRGRHTAANIGAYERGDRAISVQNLARLAQFYGVATVDLLPDTTAETPAEAQNA
jgi:transcriptional regulator with XRE-family HTH domain